MNSARYFIVRCFKHPDHQDYMPIYKVEDLFVDYPRMLVFFIEELIKKGNKEPEPSDQEWYLQKAAGIWNRNNLSILASKKLVDEI